MIHNHQSPASSPAVAATKWFPFKESLEPCFEAAARDGRAKLTDEDKIDILLKR